MIDSNDIQKAEYPTLVFAERVRAAVNAALEAGIANPDNAVMAGVAQLLRSTSLPDFCQQIIEFEYSVNDGHLPWVGEQDRWVALALQTMWKTTNWRAVANAVAPDIAKFRKAIEGHQPQIR